MITPIAFRIIITLVGIGSYILISITPIYRFNVFQFNDIYNTINMMEIQLLDPYFGGLINKMSLMGLNILPYLICNLTLMVFSGRFLYCKILIDNKNYHTTKVFIYLISIVLSFIQGMLISSNFYNKYEIIYNLNLINVSYGKFIIITSLLLATGTIFTLLILHCIDSIGTGSGIQLIIISNLLIFHGTRFYQFFQSNSYFYSFIIILQIISLVLIFYQLNFPLVSIYTNHFFFNNQMISYTSYLKGIHIRDSFVFVIPRELNGILPIIISYFIITIFSLPNSIISYFLKFIIFSICNFIIQFIFMNFIYLSNSNLNKITFNTYLLKFFDHQKGFLIFIFLNKIIFYQFILFSLFSFPSIINNIIGINYDTSPFNIISLYVLVRLIILIYNSTYIRNL